MYFWQFVKRRDDAESLYDENTTMCVGRGVRDYQLCGFSASF